MDGSEINPVGLYPSHVWWKNMWDVAIKVQVASTTERRFGSVGTITEPSLGSDPGDRARECGIETLNVPFSGTLRCDVCICPGEC
jgi:hypothetical protein